MPPLNNSICVAYSVFASQVLITCRIFPHMELPEEGGATANPN